MPSSAAVAYAEQCAAAAAAAKAKRAPPVPIDLEMVARIAASKVKSLEDTSKLLSKDEVELIPKFFLDELTLGRVLGKGGFGTVKEIKGINCKADVGDVSRVASLGLGVDDLKAQAKEDKKFIADHCLRESGDARYCIKALSPGIMNDRDLFTQGTIDMCVETMFLAVVSHPHIITMRAIGANGMFKPDYFIILDRLYDTLEARIPKWRLQSKQARSCMNMLTKKSRTKLNQLMETQLSYAYDLAGAFEYMHNKNLIYRDLKPENIGFNIRDDIVLFDFGLAREVQDELKVTDHTWKLTGETGSLRYMAPEVAQEKPYGYSADMYSFAIVVWEMLKMERPYAVYNKKMLMDLVFTKGGRPKIEESWGPALKGFLNSSWHQDLERRPTAAKASAILKREASKVAGGSEVELNNFRRKSTFVNRNALRGRK